MDGVTVVMNMAQIRTPEAQAEFEKYLETDEGQKEKAEKGLFRTACAWWNKHHLRFLAPELVV